MIPALIFCILTISWLHTTQAAIIPLSNEQFLASNGYYSTNPNEILPIQPLLIYPKARDLHFTGRKSKYEKNLRASSRTLEDNDNVIYVKLLQRKSYRPQLSREDENAAIRDLKMKDIFYVKALTNGQFSHNRLKVYRIPEFYSISVYKKGDTVE